MMNILLLGEGNFSFSRSLYSSLGLESPDCHYCITATSYDSEDEVLRKYPEAKSLLNFLNMKSRVTVQHGVDALEDLSLQLGANAAFEYIIFNFPHIGKEDCQAHKCFLGHMLRNVKKKLSENGLLYLTLAEDQAQNWMLEEMSSRNNLTIDNSFPFSPSIFPHYQMKRHQVGKSFKQRVSSYKTFALRCNENILPIQDLFDIIKINPCGCNDSNIDPLPDDKIPKAKKGKKRKMVELTEGLFEAIGFTSANGVETTRTLDSSQPLFKCKTCSKSFTSERGVRTHVYVEHVLSKNSPNSVPSAANDSDSHLCLLCDGKQFGSADAYHQHVTAKHSKNLTENTCDSNSSSAMKPEVVDVSGRKEVECDTCGATVASLEEHLQSMKPPRIESFVCDICEKEFHSSRSITQHKLFCGKGS